MNNNPLISVIVPTYNRKWLLPRTIQSLVDQSYGNLEILVINDAGEDVSDIIQNFNDTKIKYFANEKNLGLAGTRNVGLKNATGDYFIFLDDDDILLKYAIETRLYYMNRLNAEIVYTRALQDIWEKTDRGYQSVHKQLYWDCEFSRDMLLIQNIAPCNCVMFSRKAWDDSGNYLQDENLLASEDVDFWMALSRHNDFIELKLIDAEDSYRKDLTQMSGTRNFSETYPIMYKRWRHTAENLEWVIENQNRILINMGYNPSDFDL